MLPARMLSAWLFCLLAVLAGCQRTPPPTPRPTPPKVAAAKSKPAEPKGQAPAKATASKEQTTNDKEESTAGAKVAEPAAKTATKAEPAQPAAKAEDEPAAGVERFVLFTARTPLVVEVELRIGGGSHSEALATLVEEVLKAADSDSDGYPTWKEVTESKRFQYGQFGNVNIDNDNDKKQIFDLYDTNKNGAVDRAEVPRFVTRNAGGARAFSIRGTADVREQGARETPVWQLLQSDDDPTTLSQRELASAAGRLRSRDIDDDDVLLPGDFVDTAALMPGMMRESNRRRGPDAAKLLGDRASWDMIAMNLDEQYALGGRLSEASFPLLPRLFGQLDADGDGRVSKKEYRNLDGVSAHIRLAVEFDPPQPAKEQGERAAEAPPSPQPQSQIRLVSLCEELEALKTGVFEPPGRLLVQLGDMSLMFYAADQVGGADYESRAKQLLDTLDADKNGYIEEKEVTEAAQGQLPSFAAVDTDADGKVYQGEIVSFLSQQQGALRAQVHAKAGDRDDPLFAALDANGDDRLDGREIEAAPDRLTKLDRSGDGELAGEEIPSAMVVGLARGSLQNQDALFIPPTIASRAPATETPRWFTSMDTSRDGLISRREFLGTIDQFGQLDGNDDGFVDPTEAKPAGS